MAAVTGNSGDRLHAMQGENAMTRAVLLVLLLLLSPGLARGQAQYCKSVAVTPLAFGTYTGAALSFTATVTVSCAINFVYDISMGPGNSGSTAARYLLNGSSTLTYGLYQDSAHTINWGNTVGTDTERKTGIGNSTIAYTLYGLVPAGQNVIPGTFTDTINASAATATTSFQVTATISPFCTISANPLNFGTYTGSQLDAASTLTVNCTKSTSWYVNLNNGLQYSCCYSNNMKSAAGASINYELFQDAARGTPWQNTVNLDGEAGTGTGFAQSLTVYGRVFKNQYVAPGSYVDTVTATVTY